MARLIVVLVTLGVTIYALIDCLRSGRDEVRSLPKWIWAVLIVVLAPAGGLLWLLMGRQKPPGGPGGGDGPRTIAPDDDPDFLRSLDQERRRRGEPRPDGAQPTPA